MADSLIEQLPKIVADGKKEAERILEALNDREKIVLQTNEYVLPSKERSGLFSGQVKSIDEKQWLNRLVYGDNLLVMQALLAGDPVTGMPSMRGKIGLIYIDPPFDSKADYRHKIHLPHLDIEQKPAVIEQFAYSDTWKDGTVSYLKMLYPRLVLMKELLSEQGSIYVHIDWHVGHYIKVILDDIFGKENFINEIVWKRRSGILAQSRQYGVCTDTILFYGKSDNYIFSPPVSKEGAEDYVQERFKYTDENGRKYRLSPIVSPSFSSALVYEYKGYNPPSNGWSCSRATMERWDKEGKLVFPKEKHQRIQRKQYLDEWEGRPIQNLWTDIFVINPVAKERLDYATQKPEALIERIIKTSSVEQSIVLDLFAGSGTTGAVAERMGRKWIMADIGKPSVMIMRKRLVDHDVRPFLYQTVGDYQKEQFEQSEFRRIGDLANVVLNLYGALPFPDSDSPQRNLGYIKHGRILVFVDSPSRLTGYNTLKKAQELRGSFMGGWEKVVVLGWNFVTDIGQVITTLDDPKIEVLVIPPDLLDRLKTKSSYQNLIKTGKIRFSSLQYLSIKPIKIEDGNDGQDELVVELDNYVLLSPDALPLEDKDKEMLQETIAKDPLALIEYWSIDPDYDGQVFRSKWQDYRENIEAEGDPLRVIKKVKLKVPKRQGKRKVCVKAVDVFGFESAVIEEVK